MHHARNTPAGGERQRTATVGRRASAHPRIQVSERRVPGGVSNGSVAAGEGRATEGESPCLPHARRYQGQSL